MRLLRERSFGIIIHLLLASAVALLIRRLIRHRGRPSFRPIHVWADLRSVHGIYGLTFGSSKLSHERIAQCDGCLLPGDLGRSSHFDCALKCSAQCDGALLGTTPPNVILSDGALGARVEG